MDPVFLQKECTGCRLISKISTSGKTNFIPQIIRIPVISLFFTYFLRIEGIFFKGPNSLHCPVE